MHGGKSPLSYIAVNFPVGAALQSPNNNYRVTEIPMLSTVLLIVLILLLVGALPTWPHSTSWGYAPSGLLGTVLIILLILMLMGRI